MQVLCFWVHSQSIPLARLQMMWTITVAQHKVKTNLHRVYDLLAIFNISWYCENMQFWHIMLWKKWLPAGLQYLGSAVALLHFSSHWLPGDQEFRALYIAQVLYLKIMFMKMSDNTFSLSITNLSSIQFSPFFNNLWGRQNSLCWQCMVYYRNLWNLSIHGLFICIRLWL